MQIDIKPYENDNRVKSDDHTPHMAVPNKNVIKLYYGYALKAVRGN